MAPSCPPTIQKRRVRPTGHANALRFAFAALIAGCALPNRGSLAPRAAPTDAPAARGSSEIAIASWYGREFHGRRTASGEVFDQHGLSAAHPTLPLGTRIVVTNLENGKSVEVRVNDRGPFAKGRILDLSHAAAEGIGLLDHGTAQVLVESIDEGDGPPGVVTYAVQAGAFVDGDKANRLSGDLASRFAGVYLSQFRTEDALYYRVRVGPFERRDDALLRAREIALRGLPAVIVEEVRR